MIDLYYVAKLTAEQCGLVHKHSAYAAGHPVVCHNWKKFSRQPEVPFFVQPGTWFCNGNISKVLLRVNPQLDLYASLNFASQLKISL